MALFILKVKTKSGNEILKTVGPSSTVLELKEELSKLANVSKNSLRVLVGFPPKTVDISQDDTILENTIIKSGDTLIVESMPGSVENDNKNASTQNEAPQGVENRTGRAIRLVKRVVPADNSCLFSSVGFAVSGTVDLTCGTYMRQIISDVVSNDLENYSEAILGRPNSDYCQWIQRPQSWGGAIELAVLSKFYGIEIAVLDTINAIINLFGEDQMYTHRVFLMFDGVHYDPLYLEPNEPNGSVQTIFPTSDEAILRQAKAMATEARANRQYTDVNRFTLRCLDCNMFFVGQSEAMAHAKETIHNRFGEVNPS